MENTRLLIQDDFEERLATLVHRAGELVRQAVALQGFVAHWLGEKDFSGYGKEPESGFTVDPVFFPGIEQGKRGFSRLAEDLARSLSELDEQAETLAGQERSLAGAHGLLKDLTEEINGLTLAVEDTLQGKKATLSRVTGLTKEIASRTKNLKSRQESLSGAVQEAVRTLENKDQELLSLLEEMKPGVVFGDRTLGQFQDILRTQDEIIRLLGDTGRDRPSQSDYPDTREGVPQTLPSYLQALSAAAQETALDLSRLHQGLRSLNSGPWAKQWDRVVSDIVPCRLTVEDLRKDLSTPKGCPAPSAVGSVEDLEADGPWKTLSTLNEKITLLALKASLNAFRKGKTTEDLVSVLEEIREFSAQANQVLLSLADGRQSASQAPQGHLDPAAEPAGHPLWEAFLGKWEALLTALESAGPAVDRLKGGMKQQEGLVEKLLEDLARMLTQCQGLMDLSQEQALDLYPRSSPAGLQSSRRLKRMAQTQGVQLQELSRNLENAWSQVRPLRKLLQGTGLGHRALLSQLEEMQEAVDSQGHELLVQGSKGEQLVKAMEGLRGFLDTLERLLPTQSHRQTRLQESAGKIEVTAKRMNQALEEQRQLVDGLAGQARQAYHRYGPLVQAHQDQSSLAATLLEALAEIRQCTVQQISRKDKPPRDDLSS